HAELLEHRGLLELAANAHGGDFGLAVAQQVDGGAEEHRAAVGPGLAGDDVHHRGLAGAVGADDATQLAGRDVKLKAVDGLEAVEADVHVLQIQDAAVRHIHLARHHGPRQAGAAPARFGVAVALQALAAGFQQIGGHAWAPCRAGDVPAWARRLALHSRIWPGRRIRPPGMNSVTTMNSAPSTY